MYPNNNELSDTYVLTRSLAQQIKAQLKAKQYAAAETSWAKLESAVHQHSNNVVRAHPIPFLASYLFFLSPS